MKRLKAGLTYLVPASRGPQVDLTKPYGGTDLLVDVLTVDIAELDANTTNPLGDLAARGFTAVPFSGASLGEVGDAKWRTSFARAVSQTVRQLVGARGIAVLTNTVTVRRGTGEGAESVLPLVHSDFTASSAVRKFALLVKEYPAGRTARRFAAYNAWWPATAAPHDRPLALCDASTVSAADLMPTNAVVHNPEGQAANFGEIGLYRYNPKHRWSFFPDLMPDRLLVFAGHDSDPRFASQVPHGAFVNPACPPGAPPRVSVECRLFAYW
jgi:hypothetical protein